MQTVHHCQLGALLSMKFDTGVTIPDIKSHSLPNGSANGKILYQKQPRWKNCDKQSVSYLGRGTEQSHMEQSWAGKENVVKYQCSPQRHSCTSFEVWAGLHFQ